MKVAVETLVRALALGSALTLAACGGGGSDTSSTKPLGQTSTGTGSNGTGPTPPAALASLQLSAAPATVNTDNSGATTVTVSALSATNAAIPDVVVTLGADTGLLGVQTVTTGPTGTATFSFSSGTVSKANRTATLTASSGTISTQLPVQIVGSTVTVSSSTSTVVDSGGSPATLTVTAKDAGGNTISGAAVTLSTAGTGSVTLTPASGTTSVAGTLTVAVAGTLAGSTTVTASAAGATASSVFTITPTNATFAIDQTTNTTTGAVVANPSLVAMKIGDSLVVEANAPAPATQVTFATTVGSWNGGGTSTTVATGAGCVPAVAGKACATLTTAQAGLANIQAFDPAATSSTASISVAMTAAVAAKITLQATPSVVAKSVGTTSGVSTLVATVSDALGRPVGGAPVAFSIINPTGGGESVSPVVAFSASTTSAGLALGQASATFTSGSLSSGAAGVQIRASVLGTAVATEAIGTDLTASGPDVAITVGGTAGSIAFGQATVLAEANNATDYVLAMSVLVADVNGSPAPAGTVVNLSAWPIAWSTGGNCAIDGDSAVLKTGTFFNEDVNENLVLDAGEDGTRKFYASGVSVAGGTVDGLSTPPNSAGGIVPGSVTTDANGVATFNLTYGKSSALWITTRIRARTVVQGTEASSEVKFNLPPLASDVSPCKLSNSPYAF